MSQLQAFGIVLCLSGIVALLGLAVGALRDIAASQRRIADATQDALRTARNRLPQKD